MKNIYVRLFEEEAATATIDRILGSGCPSVVFLDTPPNRHLLRVVRVCTEMGLRVVVRDHHSPNPDRRESWSPREHETETYRQELLWFLKEKDGSQLVDRDHFPGCAQLVGKGEFGPEWVVVADQDPDGLTSALQARGWDWPGLVQDGAVLDGPPSGRSADTLSPLGWVISRCWAAMPPYDPPKGERREKATLELFDLVTAVVRDGDAAALDNLAAQAEAYEALVDAALLAVSQSSEVAPGVWLWDAIAAGNPRIDLSTFTRVMDAKGAGVTVTRKSDGPIAQHFGEQYSLAVMASHKESLNLSRLRPDGAENTPEGGCICHTTFLLHVAPKFWPGVLDALAGCLL